MADLFFSRNDDRNIEQALNALKIGARLLKYGRKGKPKFYPFRLSNDESSLIWFSSSGERKLKLASVSKIIPGQRTAVFRRYLCPEKEYLSFSLIYRKGRRSLDLVCKDRLEAELWFVGLDALISAGQFGRSKIDGWSDGGLCLNDSNVLKSNGPSYSYTGAVPDIGCPKISISEIVNTLPKHYFLGALPSERLDVVLDLKNMQVKGTTDAFRVSVSSAPSSSSHGSAQDECDALGNLYIWGEVIYEDGVRVPGYKKFSFSSKRIDVLLPRPLESNLVLDVHRVACGVRHSALITRQGEVFTWGEEARGRLGHGVGTDVIQPCLVESLSIYSADLVACGEFHTCAVTTAGELYTWGDGTYNAGLLGHGTNVSHWIPKRVSGPLEGLQVASVACGPWHTALVTVNGQLFTFGDGTFGVLGHGDRESVAYPREVESLTGLKTIAVACGVWHTAAVVEVIVAQSSASISSGKLFTWGDGDKNRLGHGDKESRLKPTCVPSLIDYNFHKLACGHSLTVGLTTRGHVFTMGSTVYGQLGNTKSDGKLPCLVEDKLINEYVEEVACGSYHVAVLTSKNEVYTWGKGANGRLGHGDTEDRKTPMLVEALKDRHVKSIACGSSFTAAVCLHKWVSIAEQSQCSACRQAFGFTRKKHHCYNCGLLHCHSCSSRKALGAALSPNPAKPYRVCDSCHANLSRMFEPGMNVNKRNAIPRISGDNRERLDRIEVKVSKTLLPTNTDLMKHLDNKAAKHGKKNNSMPLVHASHVPAFVALKDVSFPSTIDMQRTFHKRINASVVSSGVNSRSVSPFSRKSSPPRSATPIPTTSGLAFSKSNSDNLKKTNDFLNREVQKLHAQVDSLRQRCELQEFELQKALKKTQEAVSLAAEESAKSKAAKEVIKVLTAQLKDMAGKLPDGTYNNDDVRPVYMPSGVEPSSTNHFNVNAVNRFRIDASDSSELPSATTLCAANGTSCQILPNKDALGSYELATGNERLTKSVGGEDCSDMRPNGNGRIFSAASSRPLDPHSNGDNGLACVNTTSTGNQVEAEWNEQYEPGVYITLMALKDGTRDLKRVRFSRRRFGEHQAETWWSENREKVYEKYNVRGLDRASSAVSVHSGRRSEVSPLP